MSLIDITFILQWWGALLLIGLSCLPITMLLFSSFFDKGYIFSKIIGLIFLSYLALILGEMHILPFGQISLFVLLIFIAEINIYILAKKRFLLGELKQYIFPFLFEEILFLLGITVWSFVRAHQPDIHGLEKYMDFGMVNSILRSTYFPPADIWYPPFPINYYYFGHLATAVITRLTNIPSAITFNLMLAFLFGITFVGSFSLGVNLFYHTGIIKKLSQWKLQIFTFCSGLLTACLTTLGGNIHTLYTFFKPYENDTPVPPWQLGFSPTTFPNAYWYPNATRFIYHTIHEFPIYSFVVSDLHGHVLDIPFVLLILAVYFSVFLNYKLLTTNYKLLTTIFVGFLLGCMYMTDALGGLIYLLFAMFFFIFLSSQETILEKITDTIQLKYLGIVVVTFVISSLPFSLFFKPFASGIGILCAPTFLTTIGKIGPFLFEANHCQHSPWWQLLILYGGFIFFVLFFWIAIKKTQQTIVDLFVWFMIGISFLLILIPEFVYLKDIYPEHYRANTMFKLVYQSFIMLSISSAYIIVRLGENYKSQITNLKQKLLAICYWLFAILILFLIGIYPYFAISSYYGNLQTNYGLDGFSYFQKLYPTDYDAILWLNRHIQGQPIILEAQGDSYTDYARVSANTGLPTPLGWTVHEWLWRGSYDPLPERINDIQQLYETKDLAATKTLIKKYHISLIFIGDLERKKYTNLNENKFSQLGKLIYSNGQTKIYQIQ